MCLQESTNHFKWKIITQCVSSSLSRQKPCPLSPSLPLSLRLTLMKYDPSIVPLVPKLQQLPQIPWSFTGVTAPVNVNKTINKHKQIKPYTNNKQNVLFHLYMLIRCVSLRLEQRLGTRGGLPTLHSHTSAQRIWSWRVTRNNGRTPKNIHNSEYRPQPPPPVYFRITKRILEQKELPVARNRT